MTEAFDAKRWNDKTYTVANYMQRIFLILILTTTLSGCAVLEYIWLVPSANGEVSFDPALSNTEILDTFAQVARSELDFHNPEETYRNAEEGIVEIGPYRESNRIGYRVHAEIDREQYILTFVVAGAEIYYRRLPVDDAVQKIIYKLSPRLENTSHKAK